MNTVLRRLRGVIGVGLTWGVMWAALTVALGLVMRFTIPGSIDPGEGELLIGAMVGFVGLVSGVCFGLLLSFAEKRKTIVDLSLVRVAIWGILGSAALPLLTGMQDKLILITCPLGAVFAAGTVAMARSGELRAAGQPRLLNSE